MARCAVGAKRRSFRPKPTRPSAAFHSLRPGFLRLSLADPHACRPGAPTATTPSRALSSSRSGETVQSKTAARARLTLPCPPFHSLESVEKRALEKRFEGTKVKKFETKAELEEATRLMFERAKSARANLDRTIAKKREEEQEQVSQVPEPCPFALAPPPCLSLLELIVALGAGSIAAQFQPKKPTESTSAFQRDVRLQQLSMPLRKPPRMPPRQGFGDKPAWFAGKPRAPPQAGSARAVH